MAGNQGGIVIWTKKEKRRWRERVDWLRSDFPLPLPVKVWRVPYKRLVGNSLSDGTQSWIKVAKRLEYSIAVYTLFEEWSHLLEWADYRDHGHAWTAQYGEIIRADEDRLREE